MKKVKVFTTAYRPFMLGGDVHQPICCTLEASGPFPLGKKYEGYLVFSPRGKAYVAEKTTGALVGPSLEAVRADIKAGDPKVMRKQVAQAVEQAEKAEPVSPEQFWKLLKA